MKYGPIVSIRKPVTGNKKPAEFPSGGFFLSLELVEVAGIEPASANPPPLALHAYPTLLFFNRTPPERQGERTAIP